MDRIVGRESEIYRVMQILNRRTKNNPCLIGEPGVGKTAIARGHCSEAGGGQSPRRACWTRRSTCWTSPHWWPEPSSAAKFESRVKGLVEDVKKAGNVILFIDEIHNLVGAGDAEGSMNAANILKPALSVGKSRSSAPPPLTNTAPTLKRDAALERRFQPVTVNEPSIEDAVQVLQGIKRYYEDYHHVRISDDIVRRCVVMSERYITDRYLPDKGH